jgi:hypothetical protein
MRGVESAWDAARASETWMLNRDRVPWQIKCNRSIGFKTSSEGRLHYGSEEASAELGSTRLNTDAEDDLTLTLLLSGHSRCGGYRPGAKRLARPSGTLPGWNSGVVASVCALIPEVRDIFSQDFL